MPSLSQTAGSIGALCASAVGSLTGSGRTAGVGDVNPVRAGREETEGRTSEEREAAPTRRPTIGVASAATARTSTAKSTALLIFIFDSSLKSCADVNKASPDLSAERRPC